MAAWNRFAVDGSMGMRKIRCQTPLARQEKLLLLTSRFVKRCLTPNFSHPHRPPRVVSRFGFDPPDITVLAFVNNIDPFRLRVPKNQEILVGTATFDGGVINAHRLGRNAVRADDTGQSLTENSLDFDNRRRRYDFGSMV